LALAVVSRVQDSTHALIPSSAGIASSRMADTGEELLMRADAALYEAKRGGQRLATDAT
jgi:PleD family two-component response regulator